MECLLHTNVLYKLSFIIFSKEGTWVAPLGKLLPSAQVMIPGFWDQVPHWAPCSVGGLLLPLPILLPPLLMHVLSLSLLNK